MIWHAVISAILSIISPFWGLIFIISLGDKYSEVNRARLALISFAAVSILFFITRLIDIMTLSDVLLGVALPAVTFFVLLYSRKSYLKSILSGLLVNAGYSILRYFIFGERFLQNIREVSTEYLEILGSGLLESEEQLLFFQEMFTKVEMIVQNYYIGIWIFSMTLAIYFGALLLSKKTLTKWSHDKVRIDFLWIYVLIIALVLFILQQTRVISINLLLAIVPFFLIEGFSIIDFYWGEYLKRSRFLLFILVLAIVINPYILGLIILMGLTDLWFNYRKIQ